MADTESTSLRLRIKRDMGGFRNGFARIRRRWWFRVLAWLALLAALAVFLLWLFVARHLPSVETLRTYEPPLPTYVRSYDGLPIHSSVRGFENSRVAHPTRRHRTGCHCTC